MEGVPANVMPDVLDWFGGGAAPAAPVLPFKVAPVSMAKVRIPVAEFQVPPAGSGLPVTPPKFGSEIVRVPVQNYKVRCCAPSFLVR